jgi:hypothetical protein
MRRFALVRPRPLLVLAAVGLLCAVALASRPEPGTEPSRSTFVVVVGAAGLRWEDLSPTRTPALWRLAADGSVGALAVRSASRLTCPLDGWVTLGAGNLAAWDGGRSPTPCPDLRPTVRRPDRFGGRLLEQPRVVDRNRDLSWGAQPGALAESVRCTSAIGAPAAVAAARPAGRVDRFVAALPADPAPVLTECPLSIVDAGTVVGEGAERAAALGRVDAAVATVLAVRPAGSLVIVAGLADTEAPARLHVAIADGPGFAGGWLTSPSTGRAGYVRLTDLAPTALAALGQPSTGRHFTGTAARSVPGRPASVPDTVGVLADGDARAAAQREVAGAFLPLLVIAELLVLAAVPPLLWRGRDAGPRGPRPASRRVRRVMEVALLAMALALPAALVTELVPWWRTGSPGLRFVAVWLATLAVVTAIAARFGRRGTLAPAAVGAGIGAGIVVADVIGGGWWQLNGVAGYSAVDGDRYSGIGAIGLGVLVAGLFLVAGCVSARIGRAWRPVTVALLGSVGIVVVGGARLGADSGGAIALAVGAAVAVGMAVGALPAALANPHERPSWRAAMAHLRSPLTVTRITVAVSSAAALAVCFAAVELSHPSWQRGSLGRFLTAMAEGTAGPAIQRLGAANVTAVADSPFTVLAVVGPLFVFAVLLQAWGGLRRVLGLHPALRSALVGLAVAALLGGLSNGAGLVAAGAAVSVALPLVTLAALRALAGAGERGAVDLNGSELGGRFVRIEPADWRRDTATTAGDRGEDSVTVKSRGSLDLDLA